mgnify:CR=1 FL=1
MSGISGAVLIRLGSGGEWHLKVIILCRQVMRVREVDVEVEVILRTAPPQSESLTSERRHVTAQFEGARVAGARERNLSIQVSQFSSKR